MVEKLPRTATTSKWNRPDHKSNMTSNNEADNSNDNLSSQSISLLGTVVNGTYLIQEVLGEGAMAIVYKARHTR